MTLELRRRLVGRALIALSLWPLVQIGIVLAFDVSPWKLGAWGMYSTPIKVPHLALAVSLPGESAPRQILQPHPSLGGAIRDYMTSRVDLGPMYPADDLARRALAVYPEAETIYLSFFEMRLDRRSAQLVKRPFLYAYERAEHGGDPRRVR